MLLAMYLAALSWISGSAALPPFDPSWDQDTDDAN